MERERGDGEGGRQAGNERVKESEEWEGEGREGRIV